MLFYPLDVARVHLTAAVPPYGRCAATAGGADGTVRGALSDAVARNGVRGLYHGLLLSMAGVVPYLSLSFTAYDVLKQQLPETRAAHAAWWYPLAKMGCGAAAAAAAQTVTYPLDTVRRRLQVRRDSDQVLTAAGGAVRPAPAPHAFFGGGGGFTGVDGGWRCGATRHGSAYILGGEGYQGVLQTCRRVEDKGRRRRQQRHLSGAQHAFGQTDSARICGSSDGQDENGEVWRFAAMQQP
eukprot:353436-Chlamydomonas_euryale.AAC.1